MNRMIAALAFALVAAGSACSRNNGRPSDTTLSTDLSLAAQQRDYKRLDSISAAEQARANALNGTSSPRRTSSGGTVAHRSTSGSSGSSAGTTTSSSGGTVVKHTQRDAAIGAAAGAIIGATTSKNKVKGGLIGAAVGGVLGGVVGNNVDKTKKKP